MARKKGFLHSLAQAQREAERRRAAQLRAQAQAGRAAERARKEYERELVADQKERARLYAESRVAQVEFQNADLQREVSTLETLLTQTLQVDDFFNLQTLKQAEAIPAFNAGILGVHEEPPLLENYLPKQSVFSRLLPGAKQKHEANVARANQSYEVEFRAHSVREKVREEALAKARLVYALKVETIRKETAAQHAEVDALQRDLDAGTPGAVVEYCALVLEASSYPENFPRHSKLAYVPESKQLVVEYDLPAFDVVPNAAAYKYVRSKDEIVESSRSVAQRKALYASITAQITLRTVHELFEADRLHHLETIVFNGYVEDIDRGTGLTGRTCMVTVRTTRDAFEHLDLARVEPIACLKTLNASVSKSPSELLPVRPVLEFSMVDSRFIDETDILTGLDQRPNLMELTPGEFESLITNLFQKMGLETRLTQASRDGGVDCVAYDPRPIFGGKVVIQAKRYKNTVGVSAVRDLFGTVQNEGASKGILVTTSGYGKAAFDFAEGKPLELLSGSNLLYLLAEHAGVEAKIEILDDWKDPLPDSTPQYSVPDTADYSQG